MSAMRLTLILSLLLSPLFSDEESAKEIAFAPESPALIAETTPASIEPKSVESRDGYTINYNTVSIIEYIRFASKICKVNFIYEETDLNFTVTVVSDEPVTPANVMATLIQVLRVHGLLLLEQGNNLVIHRSPGVKQMATLVTEGESGGNAPIVTRVFRIKNAKPQSIAAIIQPMVSASAILEISSETRQLILTDVTGNVDKIAALIENLDSPHTILEIKSYTVLHNTPEFLVGLANQIMFPITQGNPYLLVPQNLSNEVFIVSTPDLVEKSLGILAHLDTVPKVKFSNQKKSGNEDVLVYKVIYRSGEDILKGLTDIAKTLQDSGSADTDLIQTIDTAKWIRETNSILFIGNKTSIEKTKEFLAAFDVAVSGEVVDEKASFFIYKPSYRSAEEVRNSILEMAENLKGSKGANQNLIEAIQNVKLNPLTHTLSFSGEEKTFPQIKELLATIDIPSAKSDSAQIPANTQFYIYKPVHMSGEDLIANLQEVGAQFKTNKLKDPAFLNALGTMKWNKSAHSLLFTGDPDSLKKIQNLIATIDIPGAGRGQKSDYFIYKVQHTTGDLIEEDLDNLAKNLKGSGVKESALLDVIRRIKYVKQTNSLLLSGDPKGIEEAKQIISQYDYPRSETAASSNFLMYKPLNVPAHQIEKSLKDLAANLKNAGLADPNLLRSIDTSKYVDTTNTLIFTGPPDTLQKIQGMIKEIDIPPAAHAPIQHVGKTSFLLYKLKNAGGQQIVSSVKNMSAELKKSGTADKDFLAALSTIKYVKETNSLFFTGNEEALKKVQNLVEQFDVTGLAAKPTAPAENMTGPGNFFVYKPQSLSGPELESILQNFAENLTSSGLVDHELFKTLNSIRWSEKTQTLLFTGSPKTLDQIKELLKEFDIPANLTNKSALSNSEPNIQAIDNTSFLVYKLQFHKGDEIQNALRQIAKDLTVSNAPINQGLLNSINSIQWLEVTNSILCSGDQDTLTRLRELIKNLDIPLKQVFIEMLVIETTMTNALTFGLEWGANYKYRNKFGAASYNAQPITSSSPESTFMQNFSGLTPPAEPTPYGKIPVSSGFDLGVIGEVIRHNGETFLTLGSLLSALQTDDETSVIMTPKILTQDGRTSTIFDGRNIPFVGSFVQNNGQNVVNTSNLEYRDIGLNLTVTPVLGNSDIVTLDINLDRTQTVGDVTGAVNFNSASAQGITTSKTSMQTTVHVPNDNFLILSGMVNNSNTKSKAGIPCLGGLPLVGAAFSKSGDTVVNSNIVIFIRPHIINSVDEMRGITQKEEDYFRDQTGTPYLEKNFNEAMELIKTVDDE
jgi:type III secretion protein C